MSSALINGFGLGLRSCHYADFIESRQDVDWLEIISENYMIEGGQPLAFLDKIRCDYPMVMHGVSLSIGGTDALDLDYLKQLRQLIDRVEPAWVSDHLCWTGIHGINLHDLLPLPYTDETLRHVSARIDQVQNAIARPLVIENVSSYVQYRHDEMSEWAFIRALVACSGCELLLDVNNVYVSSVNHRFNPREFIDNMPWASVRQIHLAGHENQGSYIIDTHDHPICDAVWDLYAYAIQKNGFVPTMIERDDNIPPLAELLRELTKVRDIAQGGALFSGRDGGESSLSSVLSLCE